jgi:Ankyrin repeats (3 copies)
MSVFSWLFGRRRDRHAELAPMLSLHRHAATNDAAAIERLVKGGANVDERDDGGLTPLMRAASERGRMEAFRALLDGGADVSLRCGGGGSSGLIRHGANTALGFAILNRNVEAVRLLLERGAKVNDAAVDSSTPLVVAVANCYGSETDEHYLEIARLLLAHGADPDIQDFNGHNALFVSNMSPEAARLILKAGVDQTLMDKSGLTAAEYFTSAIDNESTPEKVKSRTGKVLAMLDAENNRVSSAPARVVSPPFQAFTLFETESADEATRFILEEALQALPILNETDADLLFGYWTEHGTASSRLGSPEAMMRVIGETLRTHAGRDGFMGIRIHAEDKLGCAMITSFHGGVANLMPVWKQGPELLVGSTGGFA